jgi:hypothetical protein
VVVRTIVAAVSVTLAVVVNWMMSMMMVVVCGCKLGNKVRLDVLRLFFHHQPHQLLQNGLHLFSHVQPVPQHYGTGYWPNVFIFGRDSSAPFLEEPEDGVFGFGRLLLKQEVYYLRHEWVHALC